MRLFLAIVGLLCVDQFSADEPWGILPAVVCLAAAALWRPEGGE